MNVKLAQKTIEAAVAAGVRDFCVCPGARNSALVLILGAAKGLRLYSFFDERSAAFFALGRIQATGFPTAVVTTSGTAVAELLPATVEAFYSCWPLLLITADRPRSFRGSGAPQTIEQVGIFSKYVESCLDIGDFADSCSLLQWSKTRPLQMNVCFSEPLIDAEIPELDFLNAATQAFQYLSSPQEISASRVLPEENSNTLISPLVICGAIPAGEKQKLIAALVKLAAPIYAEALSGLRGEEELLHLLISGGEDSVQELFQQGLCRSVLRVGGVPTLRFWRDLESKFAKVPVYNISNNEFSGLSRAVSGQARFTTLNNIQAKWEEDTRAAIFRIDQEKRCKIEALIKKFPQSEPALIALLAERLAGQSVYLGNSLPIREWDLMASVKTSYQRMAGHRGANGIDGQVSGFLGWCTPQCENWCVIGDLTAMYDLQALWISKQLVDSKVRIVVINNKGGQIFKKIFGNEIFLNRHDFDFSTWAKMWNWDYLQWSSIPPMDQVLGQMLGQISKSVIIEVNPDEAQSDQFWDEYRKLI